MPSSKPVIAATNPLHYVYYRQHDDDVTVIGSTRGLINDCADDLGFAHNVSLLDVPNSPEALIAAHDENEAAYITWRPARTSAAILGNTFEQVHRLEQKTIIREVLPAELFPAFVIVGATELENMTYGSLCNQLETAELVLQIDDSTGGKGTFVVYGQADFTAALTAILAANEPVVASRFIPGTSRAVQCLLIGGELHTVPWWHRDLVGLPSVCNLDVAEATRYAGAILENIPEAYSEQVASILTQVASALQGYDYHGIFGVDLVVDETTGRVYVIEVNPRFTAVSHLYATAMRAVGYDNDFMTAHVAGLTGRRAIADTTSFGIPRTLPATYYYLKVQNVLETAGVLQKSCRLGVYDAQGDWTRMGWGVDALSSADEVVIIPEAAVGSIRRPGDRVFSVIGTMSALTATPDFNPKPYLGRFLKSS